MLLEICGDLLCVVTVVTGALSAFLLKRGASSLRQVLLFPHVVFFEGGKLELNKVEFLAFPVSQLTYDHMMVTSIIRLSHPRVSIILFMKYLVGFYHA